MKHVFHFLGWLVRQKIPNVQLSSMGGLVGRTFLKEIRISFAKNRIFLNICWNGRFFVLSRLISWTSYSMCDNADKRKKTNIVPNSNSLFVGFFQLKYMFWRQRIKVLSLALLTLRLSIFYPAKSKTDSWANVYRDRRTFSKQKQVFSFHCC